MYSLFFLWIYLLVLIALVVTTCVNKMWIAQLKITIHDVIHAYFQQCLRQTDSMTEAQRFSVGPYSTAAKVIYLSVLQRTQSEINKKTPPLQESSSYFSCYSSTLLVPPFSSLYAKTQQRLFQPEKRHLLPCSTCVPGSGNTEQLEEMWSSSTCQRTPHSLPLKLHLWEANNGTMF